jgi:hypothetical protein
MPANWSLGYQNCDMGQAMENRDVGSGTQKDIWSPHLLGQTVQLEDTSPELDRLSDKGITELGCVND